MTPITAIVDTHVHLWDPARFRMRWLDAAPAIDRAFTLADYAAQTTGHPIAALVYVEVNVDPAYALLEAEWAVAQAAQDPRLRGVVAHAPLEDGVVARSYLDALKALGPLVKGVRRNLQAEADRAFALRPDFVQGVQLLASYGYSFDICVKCDQLPHVTELVRRCPDVQFVLDHIGKPDIAAGSLEPWQTDLAALAGLPNVVCKISGVVTEADHVKWTPSQIAPYIQHALVVFGPERVLFGGDWPVSLLATTAADWIATLTDLTADLSAADRARLWAENARRVYRLDV